MATLLNRWIPRYRNWTGQDGLHDTLETRFLFPLMTLWMYSLVDMVVQAVFVGPRTWHTATRTNPKPPAPQAADGSAL